MKSEYQVNNLKIKYSKLYGKWQVISPDGRVLQEFAILNSAREYANSVKDFSKK